ncbi:MAG: MCE family protein [Phycisphaerae bacterium]|nr:MCE family protein [Phycisphaerae bacterium]
MSDYEKTQKTRNITVGVFVIIALGSLIWLIFKFGALPTFVSGLTSYEVKIQFPTASGVQQNTAIRFCGYQIGRVFKVTPPQPMADLKTGKVYYQALVIAHIDKDYVKIPSNVEAKLVTRGLGSSYIELKSPLLNGLKPTTSVLQQGTTLQGSMSSSSEFFPEDVQKKLEELAENISLLVQNANKIIGDPNNRENLQASIENIKNLTAQAEKTIGQADEFMGSSKLAADEIAGTLSELRLVLEKINSGEGSAGRVLNDGSLYEAMLEDAERLEILIDELTKTVKEYREHGVKVKLK